MIFGTTTVHAVAGYNQVGSFDTAAQAVADVIGLPSAAMGGTDVGPGEALLFDPEDGSSGLPGSTGSQTTTTIISAQIDLSEFATGSDFLLDLHQAKVVGSGVTGVTFDLTGLSTTPVHKCSPAPPAPRPTSPMTSSTSAASTRRPGAAAVVLVEGARTMALEAPEPKRVSA